MAELKFKLRIVLLLLYVIFLVNGFLYSWKTYLSTASLKKK